MATATQYRHEDVATVPRGYQVRTVTTGDHQVRVAFPPGPRKKGAGKLVSILHPRGENPKKCSNPKAESYFLAAEKAVKEGRYERGKKLLVKGLKRRIADVDKELKRRGAGARSQNASEGRQKSNARYDAGSFSSSLEAAKKWAAKAGRATNVVVTAYGWKITQLSPAYSQPAWKVYPDGRAEEITSGYKGNPTFEVIYKDGKKHFLSAKSKQEVKTIVKDPDEIKAIKRVNPNGNGAAQMYEDFHGRAPSEILTMQEGLMASGDYTALGDMGSLWLEPVEGEPSHWPTPSIEFEKSDKVKLATDSKGQQLYLVGGNQKLPLDYLEKHGVSTDKRFISLGEVHGISYLTEKSFDGYRESEYAHEFGEQTGERPCAFYDAELKRIVLAGGAYSIAGVDDALGASPGIVN